MKSSIKLSLKLLIIALIITPIFTSQSGYTIKGQVSATNLTQVNFFVAMATESITVDSTAGGKAFTTNKLTTAQGRSTMVQFRVECSAASPCSVRYTLDGTTVTTSVGFLLNEGDIVSLYNFPNLVKFRAIRTGANSAIIQPIYFR